MSERIREKCRKLKPIIGRKADALWINYLSAPSPKARFDAESLIEMFYLRHLERTVDKAGIHLPPIQEGGQKDGFFLGTILYDGRRKERLYLHRSELVKHLGIFATTGAGKTNIGYHLALTFLRAQIPFLVVDWKRSYRSLKSLPEARTLSVFTVGRQARPFTWNPLRPPPGTSIRTWISVLSEVLEKSHISGQGVADIFIHHFDRVFERRGFFEGSPDGYPNFHDVRQDLERIQYKGRRQLWQDSCLRILRSFTYGPSAVAFNARDPLKLEDLLEDHVVLELDMEMPKSLRVFFSETILRWLHLYRLGMGESDDLRHVLMLEEVHNLFPKSQLELQAHNGLENVFREIRSFGQGLITLTQHPSLLPVFLLGNTHTLIFLALTHEADIIAARQSLFLNRAEEVYLDRLAVVKGSSKSKAASLPATCAFRSFASGPAAVTDEDLQ